MSALSIIQQHCQLHALAVPTGVVGNTDSQIIQLLAILQECLEDMVVESKYQVVTRECLHTLTAGENQGPMSSLGGGLFGYYQAISETFFDRTLGRPLYGPLDNIEWQRIKALPNPGPFYKFRILNDNLLINPAPTSPFSDIAFEYMSTFCVMDTNAVPKATITADTDTFAFPEHIIRKWLVYRWLMIKGLPYQEDYQRAFDMLNNYIARDKAKPRICVDYPDQVSIQPGVFVPSGNWNVQ